MIGPRPTSFFPYCEASPLKRCETRLFSSLNLRRPVEAFDLRCEMVGKPYELRVWFVRGTKPSRLVVSLHGFGKASSGAQWTKVFEEVFPDSFSALHVTLPGFGLSSGRTLQTRGYRSAQTSLLRGLIRLNGPSARATILAQCGGGGFTMRTIAEFPRLFSRRHFFGRPYNAIMPPTLETVLRRRRMTLFVWWAVDRDHTKHCVPYKFYSAASKSPKRRQHIRFVSADTKEEADAWLPSVTVRSFGGITRDRMAVYYEPTEGCVAELKEYFFGKKARPAQSEQIASGRRDVEGNDGDAVFSSSCKSA